MCNVKISRRLTIYVIKLELTTTKFVAVTMDTTNSRFWNALQPSTVRKIINSLWVVDNTFNCRPLAAQFDSMPLTYKRPNAFTKKNQFNVRLNGCWSLMDSCVVQFDASPKCIGSCQAGSSFPLLEHQVKAGTDCRWLSQVIRSLSSPVSCTGNVIGRPFLLREQPEVVLTEDVIFVRSS